MDDLTTEARMNEMCRVSDNSVKAVAATLRSYISHGDLFTLEVIKGLENFGFVPFTNLLNNGPYEFSSYVSQHALTWISGVLLFLFLLLLIFFLISVPCIFSLKYAKRLQRLFTFKSKKKKIFQANRELNTFDNSFFARRFKPITFCFFIGIVLVVFFEILGSVYAIILTGEVTNFRCQLSRVSHELYNGLKYVPLTRDTRWLRPVTEGASFVGLSGVMTSKNIFDEFIIRANPYYTALQNYSLTFAPKFEQLSDNLRQVIKIRTNPESDRYSCIAQKNLAQSFEVDNLLMNTDKAANITSYLQETFFPSKQRFEDIVTRWDVFVQSLVNPFDEIKIVINNYFNANTDPLNTFTTVLHCIIYLPIIGFIILLVVYLLLSRDYYTRVTPIATAYSKSFCGLFVWFSILALIYIIITTILFNIASLVAGGCSWLHKTPYEKSYVTDYTLPYNFVSANSLNKRLLDTCLWHEHNGKPSLFRVMGDPLVDYEAAISDWTSKVRDSMNINRLLTSAQYTTLQNDIGLTAGRRPIVMPNITNAAIFSSSNHFLVPDEFVLATSMDFMELHKSFEYSQETLDGFTNRQTLLNSMKTLIDNNPNAIRKDCIPTTPTDMSQVRSLDSVLEKLDNALHQCLNPDPSLPVVWPPITFSITIDEVPYIGNNSFIRPMAYPIKTGSIISDVSNVLSGSFEGFKAEPTLETHLNKCIANIKPGVTCELFHLNTLFVATRLLSQRNDEGWKCERNVTAVVQALKFTSVLVPAQRDFEGPIPSMMEGTENILFQGRFEPRMPAFENFYDCQVLLTSLGVATDGFCEGYFHPFFWIFVSYVILTILLIISAIASFFAFLYFKQNIPITGKLITPARDVGDPKMWLELVKEYDHDREVLYKLMDESPMESGEIRDEMDSDMLHFAAFSGDIETVKYLINKGTDINRKNARGYTPLSIAVSEGHAAIVSLLIQHGADPSLHDEFGDTPLHAAARSGDIECVKAICQPMAPAPTYRNNEKEYAVDTARKQGNSYIMSFLGPLTPRC